MKICGIYEQTIGEHWFLGIFHNWGTPTPPTQIDTPFISRNIEIENKIQQLAEAQLEINPQIPKNLEFPISKQKITGIHQVQTSLNGAIIKPYRKNHNIPPPAVTIFTNETNHNKIHKHSRRIIDKNLKPSNNTISNGPPTGPQDLFVEHYDCEINEISNVKYYELNKISTCRFKPMDLEMEKTGVQLLSRVKAIEIKAFAVEGTIKETDHWCLQHIDYIRASRQNYYYSDAQRTKILDPDEVRKELARINILKILNIYLKIIIYLLII